MTETAAILAEATYQSLVLMDEVGRGTSTFDGLALAWASVETLAKRRALTLFATHYFELTHLPDNESSAFNVHLTAQVTANQIIFLHRVVEGPTSQSYGLHVARRAGIPDEIIGRAASYLAELESQQVVLNQLRAIHRRGSADERALSGYEQTISASDPASDQSAPAAAICASRAATEAPPAPGGGGT